MNKKYLLLSVLMLGLFAQLPAKKKRVKRIIKKEAIQLLTSTYSRKTSGIGFIGHIYEFTIKTNVANLAIDSVWFGATPVPCDLYKTVGGFATKKTDEPGIYYVKANKNLYASFPQYYDSTEAYKNFKTTVPFKGEAMIMYFANGKRGFKTVDTAMQVSIKTRPQ